MFQALTLKTVNRELKSLNVLETNRKRFHFVFIKPVLHTSKLIQKEKEGTNTKNSQLLATKLSGKQTW